MRQIVLGLFLGITLSEDAAIYSQIKADHWFKTHRPSQGMPITTDLWMAQIIRSPFQTLLEVCE